jgi:adenine-specific DNA methylase
MALKMFDSLLPYFGNKRKLCPVIFYHISKFLPREKWGKSIFVDAFLGSGAMSMYAKAQGFMILANDIALRSIIAGKALIENGHTKLREVDIERLFVPNLNNKHFIEREFVPDVFTRRHAQFLDNAFANAESPLQQYLLLKYIFRIRPYSKFSSPNAFNRPMEAGLFDQIKETYTKHIKDNLKSPLEILRTEVRSINAGIFHNGVGNTIYNVDAFEFVEGSFGEVLYLDPPYAGTLAYEAEYAVLDKILGGSMPVSKFSSDSGMDMLEALLAKAQHYPLWVISFGNAGGKNDLNKLVQMVKKYRSCDSWEFAYQHCGAMASEEHKQQSKEWLIIGHKNS